MACPFATIKRLMDPTTTQLHLDMPTPPGLTPRTSFSSASTSIPQTPSFEPNAPAAAADSAKSIPIATDLDLDWSLPVSALLREGTKRAHVQAENSEGAAKLVKGELPLEEYIRWLVILWRIYDTLELGLSTHASNPVLAPTYNPAMLARAGPLAEDITHLLSLLPSSPSPLPPTPSTTDILAPATPLPPFSLPTFLLPLFTAPPPALSAYLSHLHALALSSASAPRLLAHAYVRYLGDLSGGQFIGMRVKRSYGLGESDGTRFYQFEFAGGQGQEGESRADAKRKLGEVKDWFRRGMDEGVGEDVKLKQDLVEEANKSFLLNTHLFSLIRLDHLHPSSPPSAPATGKAAAAVQTVLNPVMGRGTEDYAGMARRLVLLAMFGLGAALLSGTVMPWLREVLTGKARV